MLENINVYNQQHWEQAFKGSEIHTQLTKDFDLITFESDLYNFNRQKSMTSRHWRGTRIVSAFPFWFIDQMQNNGQIYDIGCGWNLFARYYNVIGISGEHPDSEAYFGDEYGYVDSVYIKNNQERFDNIITLNALHFRPLTELQSIIKQILSMCKVNGYVFITFNICHMLKKTKINVEDVIKEIRTNLDFLQNEHNLISFELLEDKIELIMQEGSLRLLVQKR